MNNIIQSPYKVASRQVIAKLIEAGYLQPTRRYSAEAVEDAIGRLRKHTDELLKSLNGNNDSPLA